MDCLGCKTTVPEHSYGAWCDSCGGVIRPDGSHYVRHVATAKGAGGEFKILWDDSTADYSFTRLVKIKKFVEEQGQWVQMYEPRTHRGRLDDVIALVQPYARGDSADLPELIHTKHATESEIEAISG